MYILSRRSASLCIIILICHRVACIANNLSHMNKARHSMGVGSVELHQGCHGGARSSLLLVGMQDPYTLPVRSSFRGLWESMNLCIRVHTSLHSQ